MTDDRAFVITAARLRELRTDDFVFGFAVGWLLAIIPTLVYLWWRGFI